MTSFTKYTTQLSIKLVLIVVVSFLSFCSQQKYVIKRQSEIKIGNADSTIICYIPLKDSYINSSKILDSTFKLISCGKYGKLKRYLVKLNKSGTVTPDFKLSTALYYIEKNDYYDALQNLNAIRDTSYIGLKSLLTIDLNYELSKPLEKSNYKRYLKLYQELVDSNANDSTFTKIIYIRSRHLRYNY